MKKHYFSIALLFYLLSSASAPRTIRVEAAKGARPTNIDTTYLENEALETYYSGIYGKQGDTLLAALHEIIKDHLEYDYESNTDREIYKIIDRNYDLSPMTPEQLSNYNYNDNPYIIKLYADYNNDIATADTFKNPGAGRVSFDKEHIWPQSMGNFGRRSGAGSDFHHLWPSDVKGNQNAHSNYNFGVPTSGITVYKGDAGGKDWPHRTVGTDVGRNGTIPGSSVKVFEPLDEWKGDVARAMLYMPVRYKTHIDADHPQLKLVNGSPGPKTSSLEKQVYGEAGDLATLLAWNELDPPSEHEIRRNNLIYNNYQKNRNPFIDFPHWARIVYDSDYAGEGATYNPADDGGISTKVLTSISVNTDNVKKEYKKGEAFTRDGLIVNATYQDNTSEVVTYYTTTPAHGSILDEVGSITVTVTYSKANITKTAVYTIKVSDNDSIIDFTLEPIHYILIGGAILIVIILVISFYSLSKKKRKHLIKGSKKIVKSIKKKK